MVTDSPDSFLLGLSVSKIPIKALLDSGATHCFIDSVLVSDHRLPTTPLPHPMRLCLFDGSFAPKNILYEVTIPVSFAPGKILPVSFLVTPLDPEISTVIGLRWLRQYNPLVDWTNNRIKFQNPEPSTPAPPAPLVATPPPSPASPVPPATSAVPVPLAPPTISATLAPQAPLAPSAPPASLALPTPDASAPAPHSPPVSICFVNAAAFRMLSRIDNVMTGMLQIQPLETDASLRRARPVTDSDELPQDELDALCQKIPAEFHDILNVFSKMKSDKLPDHIPQFDHHIHLEEGTHPPLGPIYNTSEAEAEALREFLKENLDRGFIRQSQSDCGAPVLFIKKKDGSLRLCVDWRGLNKITKKDRYPIPLIPNLLDRLRDSEIYTKIDLRGAYNLVCIAPGDKWKTTFHTRYSSFDFMVMHFSLTNAPTTFQHFMNSVFSDVLDKFVVVYLDDILIFSKNPKEHKANVREVLLCLQKHNLYANPDKCKFSVDTTEFLSYVISPSGISMSQSKVDAILKWPAPKNVKQIQSFLGFTNFYRCFIFSYSDIVILLTRLTRKGVSWDWSNKSDAAFHQLKQAFTEAPVLTHWSPDYPMLVETDASDYALTGIISSVTPNGEIHPIAFHSCTFTDTECNYNTHDKELLAIFESFKVWCHYLEGSRHHINVVTDHKNLEYFSTTKMLSRRQAHWSEYLSTFHFTICFRPGKLRAKPNALTHCPDVYPKGGEKDYSSINPQNYRPVFSEEQLTASLRATGLQPIVDQVLQNIDSTNLHKDILEALKTDKFTQDIIINPIPLSSHYSISDSGLLLINHRIYVPDSSPDSGNLRTRVLQLKHDHPTAGHPGQNRMLQLLQLDYTWPNVRTDIKDFVNSCVSCKRNKNPHHKPFGLIQQLPIPPRPWHSISFDFIEQLPLSKGHTAILNIVDRSSKQLISIPMHDKVDAPEIAKLFLHHVFAKHGVPLHVTCDRGSEFTSQFFRSLGTLLNIKLHFTSGYNPQADGQSERANQTLEQYLRHYCSYQQDNWSDLLPLAEFAYNNTPNASTGVSPFFANKGYHPVLDIHPERDVASLHAREFTTNLDKLHKYLADSLKLAQE
jgi:hypothetical protein